MGPTHGDKLNHYQDSAAVRKIAHCDKNSKNKFSLLRDTAFIMCFEHLLKKMKPLDTLRDICIDEYWIIIFTQKPTSIM